MKNYESLSHTRYDCKYHVDIYRRESVAFELPSGTWRLEVSRLGWQWELRNAVFNPHESA